MELNDQYLQEELEATSALVDFFNHYDCPVPNELSFCLAALQNKDAKSAARYAKKVRPFGMGSLTDWSPGSEGEDRIRLNRDLESVVRNWCQAMSDLLNKYRGI